MLQINLSTRPFYNERAVHLALGLVGILVLALTTFNVTQVITLSQSHTEFTAPGRKLILNKKRTAKKRQ